MTFKTHYESFRPHLKTWPNNVASAGRRIIPDKLCGYITTHIKPGDLSRADSLNEQTQRSDSFGLKNMSHFRQVPAFILRGNCRPSAQMRNALLSN